jgi:copper chaperone NosL
MKKRLLIILNSLLIVILSCSTDPEPINYGSDQCDHCRMTIMDNKFGAEIITSKGKVYKFDAAECLVKFVKEGKVKEEDIKTRLVTDASKPGQFTDALNASYLISENFPSPMGANLSAYSSRADAEKFQKDYSGELMTWDEILTKLKANR